MRILSVLLSLAILSVAAASGPRFEANSRASSVTFSGEHAGRAFSGVFKQWKATLVLPPAEAPSISAEFDLSSAETGNAMYDETLLESDWFDVDTAPRGTFVSSSVVASGSSYAVTGTLTLRGQSNPVHFTLTTTADGLEATFDIDRLAYGIGAESDPEAEWVSRAIGLKLRLVP